MFTKFWYGARYYWHVLLRKLRIAPFGRYAKTCITLEELIADWERDPETRKEMAEARDWVERATLVLRKHGG